MKIVFLGTGTSHGVPMIGCACAVCRSTDPRDTRLRPSIYAQFEDGTCVLVDTTPDLRQQALTHRIARVDAVLFTHTHADHIFGLDEVRRFNAMQKQPMPIHGSAEALAEIRRIFAYVFSPTAVKGGGVPDLRLHAIDGPFQVGGQTVVPVPVLHGDQTILAFRFGAFAYATDCSGISDASVDALSGLDVLVLDALRHRPHPTHFTVEQAVAMAQRIGAKQTYLTHICHDLGHDATCRALPPGVTLAYDGLTLAVD